MLMTDIRTLPIGVFDSGLGGLSVLQQCVKLMPNEDFIYYGDSLHAPYGTKSLSQVRELTMDVVDQLTKLGIKGLVVACNTATSAAIRTIREDYPKIPVVGIEPAIKPAALRHPGSMVLVLATPRTLKEEKFQFLKGQYERIAEIVRVPCEGLVEYIEHGILKGPELEAYLREKLEPYSMTRVGAIVLGCTHYPFIREALQQIAGDRIEILDGSFGTAKEIRRRLKQDGLLTENTAAGRVLIYNSAVNKAVELVRTSESFVMKEEVQDELLLLSVKLLTLEIS